jgi:hypothetical protein
MLGMSGLTWMLTMLKKLTGVETLISVIAPILTYTYVRTLQVVTYMRIPQFLRVHMHAV